MSSMNQALSHLQVRSPEYLLKTSVLRALAQEREALAQEREALAQEREALAQEREALAQEHEALAQEPDPYVYTLCAGLLFDRNLFSHTASRLCAWSHSCRALTPQMITYKLP
ncbi:hypothetical protein C8J57DRAFT_1507966 [Mycena rebaudengoi]|nr:hypothetical protein C8J57DRAFT_1507966 [Mycena rebaudengoi]